MFHLAYILGFQTLAVVAVALVTDIATAFVTSPRIVTRCPLIAIIPIRIGTLVDIWNMAYFTTSYELIIHRCIVSL